jgi:TPR repeat protein
VLLAFSLFMNAAKQGHAEAMYHLAKFPEFVSEPFHARGGRRLQPRPAGCQGVVEARSSDE